METLKLIAELLIPVALVVVGYFIKPYIDQKVKEGKNNTFARLVGFACKFVEVKYNNESGKAKFSKAMNELEMLCEKEGLPFDISKATNLIENFVWESNVQNMFVHKAPTKSPATETLPAPTKEDSV